MFSEDIFPEKVAFGFRGGAGYLTSIASVPSGEEQRNIDMQDSLGKWTATQQAKRQTITDQLIAFFRTRKGRAHGFRFKDWTDYKCTQSQGILVSLGGGEWQLYKRYTWGANTEDRIITKPRASLTNIIGTGTYALDDTTGIVTVLSGDDPTGWSGEFDVPCRCDFDQQEIEVIGKSPVAGLLFSWGNIEIVEIRDIA